MNPRTPRFPRPDYRALARYDPGRRPVEVDLSDNTNLWGAHPAALAAVRGAAGDDLARYPHLYADALRDAVSRRFGVPAECVTTGCGSDDVLDSAFRACAPPGGTVAFAAPTFSMAEPLALMNGRTPRGVPWSVAMDDPAALLQDDPVLVYACRPNNPTGALPPAGWLDALLDAAGEDGPLVLLDEAYADFAADTRLETATARPRLLVTRTLSKAFGLAGMRVGFGVGTPETVEEVDKSRGPYKVGTMAQRAAAAALEDPDGWTERIVAETRENRRRLRDGLVERGLAPLPSEANFLYVPVVDAPAWGEALRERGVAVRPFPACPDAGDGFRVTVGPWALMERFLEAVERALDAGLAPAPPRTGGDG